MVSVVPSASLRVIESAETLTTVPVIVTVPPRSALAAAPGAPLASARKAAKLPPLGAGLAAPREVARGEPDAAEGDECGDDEEGGGRADATGGRAAAADRHSGARPRDGGRRRLDGGDLLGRVRIVLGLPDGRVGGAFAGSIFGRDHRMYSFVERWWERAAAPPRHGETGSGTGCRERAGRPAVPFIAQALPGHAFERVTAWAIAGGRAAGPRGRAS